MTKEEILNGMSEEEFYRLYPTKESWEEAQAKMAYGGTPYFPGIPFGAGITMAHGGTPCMECGGLHKAEYGFNNAVNYGSFSVPMGYGGDLDKAQDGRIIDWAKQQQQALAQRTGQGIPEGMSKYYGAFDVPSLSQMDSVVKSPVNPNIGMAFKGSKSMLVPLNKSVEQDVRKINKPYTVATPLKRGEREVYLNYQEFGGAYDPSNAGTYPILGAGGYDFIKEGVKDVNSKMKNDTTIQGGNQDYLSERKNTTLNFIKNNVLKNMQQEEAEAAGNTFMQMGGKSFDMINPQNAALQNMYYQRLNQMNQQSAIDNFRFKNLLGIPQAQKGMEQPTHSNILHQLAAEFGPASRRTGLPLFPGNMSPYYGIGKKDAKKLVGVPEGFRMEGLEVTPEWGLGARAAMNIGNWFRDKDEKRTVPGWAPKKIHYKFTGKAPISNHPGYAKDQPSNYNVPTKEQYLDQANPYGPVPAGTTKAPVPFMPASIKPGYNANGMPTNYPIGPGGYNWNMSLPTGYIQPAYFQNPMSGPRASQILNESDPMQGFIPKQIYMDSQLRKFGGNYFYDGGFPMQTMNNPVKLQNTTTKYAFINEQPTPDLRKAAGLDIGKTMVAEPGKTNPYIQGPTVEIDPNKRPEQDVTVEGDLRRKWYGVGETIGQWAIPTMNIIANAFEQKDVKKFKKKLEESMLADNTFLSTPMNAKNRGDYDINSGMFRMDQMVPVQFPGNVARWGGFNTMALGGSYEEGEEIDLSPEEIEELRQQGYEIEYLD